MIRFEDPKIRNELPEIFGVIFNVSTDLQTLFVALIATYRNNGVFKEKYLGFCPLVDRRSWELRSVSTSYSIRGIYLINNLEQ